ncbi:hypothetical protein [Chamaesiphon polymorphus]|uniref:Uncharacterized protein n=1 Tax=Chamaesiphon polymorphus CCALA 037 TaxID=2107692 RepID=A0A2T1GN31_9CYAN|nr:hypothetical protein [Chamaesiphon polymorphus]PSB59329.1 hypothetical protein C7B77_01415 [Chamaesiphon polymorphus CCALA 037]
MNYKPSDKKDFSRIILLSWIVPGFFLLAYHWLPYPRSNDIPLRERAVESPESKVRRVIHKELKLYKETESFSTNSNVYLSDYEKKSNNYSIRIKPSQDRLIISVVWFPDAGSYSAFGVIKILRSKPNNADRTTNFKWQYLETISFVCEGEKNVTLPSDLEITRVTKKCPLGYNQTYNKKKSHKKLL